MTILSKSRWNNSWRLLELLPIIIHLNFGIVLHLIQAKHNLQELNLNLGRENYRNNRRITFFPRLILHLQKIYREAVYLIKREVLHRKEGQALRIIREMMMPFMNRFYKI